MPKQLYLAIFTPFRPCFLTSYMALSACLIISSNVFCFAKHEIPTLTVKLIFFFLYRNCDCSNSLRISSATTRDAPYKISDKNTTNSSPPPSAYHIISAKAMRKRLRHKPERRVAGIMAVCIINLFEIVYIKK